MIQMTELEEYPNKAATKKIGVGIWFSIYTQFIFLDRGTGERERLCKYSIPLHL